MKALVELSKEVGLNKILSNEKDKVFIKTKDGVYLPVSNRSFCFEEEKRSAYFIDDITFYLEVDNLENCIVTSTDNIFDPYNKPNLAIKPNRPDGL